MKKIYLAVVWIVFTGLSVLAQSDNGAIKIVLQDKTTKEAIPFANVVAFKDGVQVGVATTNMDGEAVIKPLGPGKYTVKGVYVGYQATEVHDVVVGEGKTAYVSLPLSNGEGVKLDEVEVVAYQVPLIDPDTKSGQTVTREDYQNLATKDINSVAATTAGVYQADEGKGVNVRGGRSGQTTYFVDGVKVFGQPNLPQQAIEQLNVITGGVPANYGDLTSGAIAITTRGPQAKPSGGVELITSQYLDPFGYNSLGFSYGGPIYKKRDSTRRTVLGFFLSGQGNYLKDANPSFVPLYVVKDSKLQELKDQPLVVSPSGSGLIRTSEFVTKSDLVSQKYRPNNQSRVLSLSGKLDYAPTPNTNISLGGFVDFSQNRRDLSNNPVAANNLFNSVNNPRNSQVTYRGNLSITQKFGNPNANKEKTQALISNSYFKFLVSYEQVSSKVQSAKYKTDFFKYGYVGNFERTFLDKDYAYNYEFKRDYQLNGTSINAYEYQGSQELPVKFTPGTANPDAALYTSYVMDHFPQNQFKSMNNIVGNNGLRNGDGPATLYNLYNNFGDVQSYYRNNLTSTFRVVSSFNADIKNHAVTFGLEFDQRTTSFYFVDASGLWTTMRQITDAPQHLKSLDKSNPILVPELSGLIPYYYYEKSYEPSLQSKFYEKLLDKMGLPKDYRGFINPDGMDPSTFSLDMFSAEDLLGNGGATQRVNYIGFTHDGKRTKDKVDISDFLNKKDETGRNLFPVGSFKPIYASVYVMDKFDFKDIKFNIGLRVDRYDANQQVLKDNYAFHELAHVGDLASIENLPAGFTDNIPGNISKDAAVYVAQNPTGGKSPLSIKGYREGDKWYNSEGNEISDPNLINSSDARPIPLYKDNANYNSKMSTGGFTSYLAAYNAMPRIAFSFPISDVASFYAHYDITTQRPGNNNLSPLDYYFIGATGNTPLVSNPNQRPQQTVDYELGFQQVLNERKNASLKITSFYREMRRMINQRTIVGAYPRNYTIYDNIDFGTVKGMTFEFDFRRTGGSRINLNYTLQFAEGSGSNTNSGANLASSGQPNLRVLVPLDFDQRHSFVLNYDYRFGKNKDYKGPTYKTKSGKTAHIFEDMGFNLTFLLGSGTPYTRWSSAVATQGGNGRSSILGQINGSYKPWNFRSNLRIDKNIDLVWRKDDPNNKKTATLDVYLQVLNLFNTQNILGVYAFTGTPDDDGYLSSSQARAALAIANSPTAYSDMYRISVNNPNNYSLPRQIRLGVLFNF